MATIRNKATLDSKPFSSGVDQMKAKVGGFSKSLGSMKRAMAGAFATGAVANMARRALEAADNVDNLSKQLGLGRETTQSLQVAFQEAGLELTSLNTTMATLQQKQAEAISGNKKATESFAAFGLSIADLQKMSPEQLLEAISKRLGDTETDASAAAAMFQLMGSRSARLKNVLQETARDGFGQLNSEMIKAGRIMEDEVISRLDRMEEKFARQKQRMGAGAATLLSGIIGGVEEFAGGIGAMTAGGTFQQGQQIIRAQDQVSQSVSEIPKIMAAPAESMEEAAETIKEVVEALPKEIAKKEADRAFGNLRAIGANLITPESLGKFGELDPRANLSKDRVARIYEIYGKLQTEQGKKMMRYMQDIADNTSNNQAVL